MVKDIPLDKLVPPYSMLRPVMESSIEFMEMVDSVREHGVCLSICVRPHPTREGMYEVIDGMWRFSCAKALDFDDIPCIIKDAVDDAGVLALQIQLNAVSYETRPVEFARQMQRMMDLREQAGAKINAVELSRLVGKRAEWVRDRLKLNLLHEELQDEITTGNMGLRKGMILAGVKKHKYQLALWQEHKDLNTRDFQLAIGNWIQNVYDDMAQKRVDEANEPVLKARYKGIDLTLIELDSGIELAQIIVREGLTTAQEGAKAALEWVLHLDLTGREGQVTKQHKRLTQKDRTRIIGEQRYEELTELRRMREERNKEQRDQN